ncbi:MAG: nuclear transport factor 2 family protein, partial [Ilumatobacteraceae bacterium]
ALFVPDGTWSTSLGDTMCDGHDAIRTHFGNIRASGRIRASAHMVTNPLVDIDGDRATVRWSFTMVYTGADEGRYRILGFYDDVMERADGRWQFRSLHSTVFDYVRLDAHDATGR